VNPPSAALLEVRQICRAGDGGGWLLRDVSLGVEAGQRVGLVGPTGAGKTVLLRAMAMLDPASAGEIRWQGRPVRGNSVPEFRTRVSYLQQRPVLMEGTVEENLRLPLALRQHRRQQFERDRALAWLARLGRSESFLTKRHQDLSGGEGQLVSLVRALELDPQVLLLDEPTSALDRPTAAQFERLVGDWLAERPGERAYVWVSHDPDQTERMCDRLVYLNDGHIAE
jgi:putative ABC transport system ATP-binding protein